MRQNCNLIAYDAAGEEIFSGEAMVTQSLDPVQGFTIQIAPADVPKGLKKLYDANGFVRVLATPAT